MIKHCSGQRNSQDPILASFPFRCSERLAKAIWIVDFRLGNFLRNQSAIYPRCIPRALQSVKQVQDSHRQGPKSMEQVLSCQRQRCNKGICYL